MSVPDRDDNNGIVPEQRKRRAYQVTLDFDARDERTARSLTQRLIGVLITGGATVRSFGLADVTRGKYRAVVQQVEKRRGRRRKRLP
jgi:hypothetical protein